MEEKDPVNWFDAWQQLVYEHSPFRAIDDQDFQGLLRQLSDLERLFLTTPALASYSAEWRVTADASRVNASGGSDASGSPSPGPNDDSRRASIHVAAIQLELMEDAFYSLRLDRYANAPDNRGWMNLFRQWSLSPTFREHVRELEPTLSRQFIEFYYPYIEGLKIDDPVPHPWDITAAKKGERAYSGKTKRSLERCMTAQQEADRAGAKGIFLDPGLIEAGSSEAFEPRPVLPQQHGTPPPTTASKAAGTATPAAGGPAAAPAPDSSKSTD